MDNDNMAYNHWLRIAKAQKIGVLQVIVSDENICNWNGKPPNPPSLIVSTYCHYFHTSFLVLKLSFCNRDFSSAETVLSCGVCKIYLLWMLRKSQEIIHKEISFVINHSISTLWWVTTAQRTGLFINWI